MSLIEPLQRVRLNRRYHAPAQFERFKDANWWRFPYGVGRQLASLGIFDRKIKCALLMPVVDYAASFLAAGLLIGYAATRLNSESELAEHTNPAQSACAGRESNSP